MFGIVASNAKNGEYKKTYTIKVESINGDAKYKNTNLYIYVKPNESIDYGKRISFTRRIYETK